MKTAIVTGSTGFIGSAFVEYLIKCNIKVFALGRKPLDEISESRRRKLKGANYIKLDMSEIGQLDVALDSIGWNGNEDCVFFNLAWGGGKITVGFEHIGSNEKCCILYYGN